MANILFRFLSLVLQCLHDQDLECHFILILMLTSKVSRLLGAMDKRGEVVEELEAVVKLYRERIKLKEEEAREDSVEEKFEDVVKLYRERIIEEKAVEDSAEGELEAVVKL